MPAVANSKRNKTNEYGDEVPRWKDFIMLFAVLLALMALSWLANNTLHWFH
ncbi:MAG TPA: hypothetical protein PKM63_07345 [Panacibacter sp.]|nr:hypothetical protein [Panacibacter sp.]HNP44084.1 hypothetical protein [Panacibacter sp.]